MTVQYQNLLGEAITENQAVLDSSFIKIFSENAAVIKEEEYESGVLRLVTYYKSDLEPHEAIVKEIMINAPTQALMIIEREILSPIFSKEFSRSYEPLGNLVALFRHLYKNGDTICSQQLELISGLPILEFTRKFYYNDLLVADGPAFIANYKADGSIDYIHYKPSHEYDSEPYGPDQIDKLRKYLCWTISEMEYYLTATFEP
jgi:hypothetical protein